MPLLEHKTVDLWTEEQDRGVVREGGQLNKPYELFDL